MAPDMSSSMFSYEMHFKKITLILSEIGLDSNPWLFIPSNMSSTDGDEIMTARGNCYYSCFQENLPEITIHSIMGFGSKHVEKMKIVRTTGFETARSNASFTREMHYSSSKVIYNEDHVNVRYQAFKVIRSSKIRVSCTFQHRPELSDFIFSNFM